MLWEASLHCQGHWGDEEYKGILTFFFFISLSVSHREQELRQRGLRSRGLNLIKLSGGREQGREDHRDKRERKAGKERTLQLAGDGCALSDSSGGKWNICLRGRTPGHYGKNGKLYKKRIFCGLDLYFHATVMRIGQRQGKSRIMARCCKVINRAAGFHHSFGDYWNDPLNSVQLHLQYARS